MRQTSVRARSLFGILVWAAAAAAGAEPSGAEAHVEWFCAVADVASPPLPVGQVVSPYYPAVGAGVLALVFTGLAFSLVIGRGLLRLRALALMVVFVSAMPKFGHLDAVGHLPILATCSAARIRSRMPRDPSDAAPSRTPRPSAGCIPPRCAA